ncbi:hypothetical protein Tco_1442809, partial [Tanacetum coccineum]
MIVMEKIAAVIVVVEKIAVEDFLGSRNFGSLVGVDDTQVVVDKLGWVTFAFQTEDTVARKSLSFVNHGRRIRLVQRRRVLLRVRVDTQLSVMFPRIYALEINKDCTVANKL